MTPAQREKASACLDTVAGAITVLAQHGQEVSGMVASYSWLRSWLLRDGSVRELSAKLRDVRQLRDVLDEAAHGKSPGDPRLDSAVRSSVAWMLWRIASYMLGQHDESIDVWLRMGSAQVVARYDGVEPKFSDREPEGGAGAPAP